MNPPIFLYAYVPCKSPIFTIRTPKYSLWSVLLMVKRLIALLSCIAGAVATFCIKFSTFPRLTVVLKL